MRRFATLVVIGLLAAGCSGGDADPNGAATPEASAASTTAPTTTSVSASTTTTTTEAAPTSTTTTGAPTGPVVAGEDGVAVVAGPDIVVNRVSGRGVDTPIACLSPVPTMTDVALVLTCPHADPPTFVAIEFDASASVSTPTDGHQIVAAGDQWVLTCPTDGECAVRLSTTLAPLELSHPIPGGEPPWLNSGLGELLVVGRGTDRSLFVVVHPAVERIRTGTADDTWGGLVEVGHRSRAMEVQIDTGGIDGRPEVIEYVDPITGSLLDYDDGAEHNTLFDIGVGSIRVRPDLTIQEAAVRAFDSAGTELWSWSDSRARATGADGRVWIWSVGSDELIEIQPLTGVEIGRTRLPGPVTRVPAAVSAHHAGDGDVWIVARVDGDIGDQVVLIAV